MTAHLVVPTLAGAPPQNQSLEGFWVASCESRANRGRSISATIRSSSLLIIILLLVLLRGALLVQILLL